MHCRVPLCTVGNLEVQMLGAIISWAQRQYALQMIKYTFLHVIYHFLTEEHASSFHKSYICPMKNFPQEVSSPSIQSTLPGKAHVSHLSYLAIRLLAKFWSSLNGFLT